MNKSQTWHKISVVEESDRDEEEEPISMRRLNIVECDSEDEASPSSQPFPVPP